MKDKNYDVFKEDTHNNNRIYFNILSDILVPVSDSDQAPLIITQAAL